ncbi:MAG TPA: glycosyltransferase family 4 protein [Nitrospirota bacterium]|nr:glycosyltransferase family 4 protein [Nitrospirota bacterium]
MNILLIISKNDRYGAQRIFLDQVHILDKMANRVIVVGRGTTGFVPDAVRAMGVEYHGLPLDGIKDLFRLRQLVRSHAIDIIHTTLDRADYFGVLLSFLTQRPVVTTMMVPRYHPGLRFADKVVVLSNKLKKVVLSKGIKQEKVSVIRPGIDVDRFFHPDQEKREAWRAKLNTDRYSTVFCHVASIIPRKGHLISLELMSALKKLGENPLLLVIGDPLSGDYYMSLVDAISSLDLKDNVQFTGWTADTSEILSLSHITLLPSENEALGIVLMEGMAAGTPIVAREGEGGAELVEDFGSGLLYSNQEDIKTLAEKIVVLRQDKARYQALSDDCRKNARDFFSMDSFGEKLMEVYRAVGTH